jgi:hypothetical protein
MKVRMLTIMAGPSCNYRQGEVITVLDIFGRRLIQEGYAELVENTPSAPATVQVSAEPVAEHSVAERWSTSELPLVRETKPNKRTKKSEATEDDGA